MTIISGKVTNAKLFVLGRVAEACDFASLHNGDYYPGPVSRALDYLIAAVRVEERADGNPAATQSSGVNRGSAAQDKSASNSSPAALRSQILSAGFAGFSREGGEGNSAEGYVAAARCALQIATAQIEARYKELGYEYDVSVTRRTLNDLLDLLLAGTREGQVQEKDHARCDQPQPGSCAADLRGDHRGGLDLSPDAITRALGEDYR